MEHHPNAPRLAAAAESRRVLPHSLEAEMSVVGGVLLHPRTFAEVSGTVRVEDFYHPAHAAIYAAMQALDIDGQPIDQLSVADRMRSDGTFVKLRSVNGEAYFAELTSAVVTVENIGYHARMVVGRAVVRKIVEASQEIAARGYSDFGEPEEFAAYAERAIAEIAQRQQVGGLLWLKNMMASAITRLQHRVEHKSIVTGVPSGFVKLDALTAGFQPSQLSILAARPSMGKTALCMNAMLTAALGHGIPGLMFSIETGRDMLVDRLIAAEARVDSTRLRSGYLEARDWLNITHAAGRLIHAPLWIDDTSGPTLSEIRAKARKWRYDPSQGGRHAMAMIGVDYLQLIEAEAGHREGNREQAISATSRGLKGLAKELKCAVVALAQLNRQCEARSDKRPVLSDLRESGAIEQDADLIAFIYRDEKYNKDSPDKGIAEVNVAKQKEGPLGTVRLAFLANYVKFENLSERDDG